MSEPRVGTDAGDTDWGLAMVRVRANRMGQLMLHLQAHVLMEAPCAAAQMPQYDGILTSTLHAFTAHVPLNFTRIPDRSLALAKGDEHFMHLLLSV